jgi:hypothetical protein
VTQRLEIPLICENVCPRQCLAVSGRMRTCDTGFCNRELPVVFIVCRIVLSHNRISTKVPSLFLDTFHCFPNIYDE